MNMASAGADGLSGSFSTSGAVGFTANLSDAFANLAPGGIWDFLALDLNTATLGTNTETVTFYPLDVNGTGYAGLLPEQTLTVTETTALCFCSGTLIRTPAGEVRWRDLRSAIWWSRGTATFGQ